MIEEASESFYSKSCQEASIKSRSFFSKRNILWKPLRCPLVYRTSLKGVIFKRKPLGNFHSMKALFYLIEVPLKGFLCWCRILLISDDFSYMEVLKKPVIIMSWKPLKRISIRHKALGLLYFFAGVIRALLFCKGPKGCPIFFCGGLIGLLYIRPLDTSYSTK